MIKVDSEPRGVHGSVDLLHHFVAADHGFAFEMTAPFREDLILYLQCRCTRSLEKTDSTTDVDGVSESGIGIDDER